MVSWPIRVQTLSRTNVRTAIGDTKRSNVDHVGRSTLQLIQRVFDGTDLILCLHINDALLEHLERFAD